MKKISLAIGTAAVLALTVLSAPAQAQLHHGDRGYRPRVVIVQPAPLHIARHDHYQRHDREAYYRHARRDSDRDGTPDRYDRRPNNPYRR